MDLYHLQTFCRVARLQSFTRAAEDLSLSQSAVSRHIEALEQEHGTQLFTRSGRGAALTEAGQRLLEYAEQMLHLSQEAARALAELRDVESGRLAVGASTTPGNYLLGPVVAAYQDRYPGIDLHLDIRDSQSVVAMLEAGTVDMAVLPEFPVTVGITTEPFMPDELLLLAAPTHPLAARPAVRLEDLAGTRVLLREPGSHTRRAIEQMLAARKVTLAISRELGSTEAIKQAVAAGGGVAFCSRYAVILELRQGVLKALSGPDLALTRQFVVAYPKGGRRAPATMAFAALLRKLRPLLESRVAGANG
ncbi:MAG TPA: LysR family transcriptional regulator [Symbiobacteriaceae bacterium]